MFSCKHAAFQPTRFSLVGTLGRCGIGRKRRAQVGLEGGGVEALGWKRLLELDQSQVSVESAVIGCHSSDAIQKQISASKNKECCQLLREAVSSLLKHIITFLISCYPLGAKGGLEKVRSVLV